MNRSFEQKLSNGSYLSRDKIFDLYIIQNKTLSEMLEIMNISQKTFYKILQFYHIQKPQSLITKNSQTNNKRISQVKQLVFQDVIDLYISENLTRKQTAKRLGVTVNVLKTFLKLNNIKKDTVNIHSNTVKAMKEKYGVENSAFLDTALEKSKQTCLVRYGSEIYMQSEDAKRKRALTNKRKYGAENVFSSSEFQNKILQTLKIKYGVEYACLLPQCSLQTKDSGPNIAMATLLAEKNLEFKREFILDNYRYDFLVGDNKLIEINPSATHNSTFGIYGRNPLTKEYHFNKTKAAKEKGFRCINVFEWENIELVVNEFCIERETVAARLCLIKEVKTDESAEFLKKHHVQGYAKSDICYGLYYKDQLVSVMSFGKSRFNKNYEYELIRYCSSYNIIGGAQKLFNFFIRKHRPRSIMSYCDYSKFDGYIYEKLGFVQKDFNIGKHWFHLKTKKHITDNLLRAKGFNLLLGKTYGFHPKGSSNSQLMIENGFVEVYDAGQMTFVWLPKE